MSTVVVCDSAPLVRARLGHALGEVPGIDRVEVVSTATELLAARRSADPDLVLLGLRLPDLPVGWLVRRLVATAPDLPVIAVVGPGDADQAVAAVRHGCRGYLRVDAAYEELCAAVAHALSPRTSPGGPAGPPVRLSRREHQVLTGMAAGKSNSEIGKELFLTEDTVKTHARRLYRKLGVHDRAHAVASGFRRGLVR